MKSETAAGYVLTPVAGLKYLSSYSVLHDRSLCNEVLLSFESPLTWPELKVKSTFALFT
jgi:hypothetical protein